MMNQEKEDSGRIVLGKNPGMGDQDVTRKFRREAFFLRIGRAFVKGCALKLRFHQAET